MRRREDLPIQRARPAAGAPIREGLPSTSADPRELWRVIARRRGLVGAFALTVVLVACLPTLLTTHENAAETHLLIERLSPQVDDIGAVMAESGAPRESDSYNTQFELLESRAGERIVGVVLNRVDARARDDARYFES
jgi:uncharacterized protein involved in exopolysaccharide biosynthesis